MTCGMIINIVWFALILLVDLLSRDVSLFSEFEVRVLK